MSRYVLEEGGEWIDTTRTAKRVVGDSEPHFIIVDEYEVVKYMDALETELRTLRADKERLEEQKDGAYTERDRLVAALSKLLPSWLERHPDEDADWEDDWRWIVFVNAVGGQRQMSWHIHDSELEWFDHLDRMPGNSWDGHTTEEKYRRLAAIDTAREEKT